MQYRNPVPTVDIIIEFNGKVILVKRKNPPLGYAIPGGYVDYGESLEHAAVREAKEETSLDVELVRQFHTYSDPQRDPRGHTVTTVYVARPKNPEQEPGARDDAAELFLASPGDLPDTIAFDHEQILRDYFTSKY